MRKLFVTSLFLIMLSNTVYAFDCGPTKVKEIDPNRNGSVWLKFTNGTQFAMNPEIDPGMKNILSVALAARAMNADVNIVLSDASECGAGGNATSWSYVELWP